MADIEKKPQAVAALYADLDAEITARQPVCRASGRCCRFEEFGHRLYVTTLELQYFADRQALAVTPSASQPAEPPSFPLPLYQPDGHFGPGCPWQVNGLCTAREGRPLGCRIYFCDASSQAWQNEVYERYHQRLIRLHEIHGVTYRYLEWRAALALVMPKNM